MRKEVEAATDFIMCLVNGFYRDISESEIRRLKYCLTKCMFTKFHRHWFLNNPTRGQGYRCLRFNTTHKEPLLEKAAILAGVRRDVAFIPMEVTIWVDPDSVYLRYDERETTYYPIFEVNEYRFPVVPDLDDLHCHVISKEDVIP